ncbi:MAG: amino acid adenylation domain-containing protein, partial [Proteobacteria bacterium]
MSILKRSLSPNEKLYIASSKYFPHLELQLVVEGKGEVDEVALRRAVEDVAAHSLACRFILKNGSWQSLGPIPHVRVSEITPDFQGGLSETLRQLQPLNVFTGPSAEVQLYRSVAGSVLMFRAHHAIMDGNGLGQWAALVCRALAGKELRVGREMPLSDEEFALRQGARYNRKEGWIARSPGPKIKDRSDLNFDVVYSRISLIHAPVGLGPKLLAALRSQYKATETFKAMIPVDLRALLSEGEHTTANLSLPLLIDIEATETWPQLFQRFLKAIEDKDFLALSLKDRLYKVLPQNLVGLFIRNLWQNQLKSGRYFASVLYSHIGRFEAADYSFPGFVPSSLFFLPVAFPGAPFSFIITEFAKRTEICIGMPAGIKIEGEQILRSVMKDSGLDAYIEDTSSLCSFGLPMSRPFTVDFGQTLLRFAQSQPEAIALEEGGQQLSYESLIRERDKIATLLRSRVPPAGRVVIFLNRSIETVLCILACYDLGLTFIPVDPSYPRSRIDMILDEVVADLIIIERGSTPQSEKEMTLAAADDLDFTPVFNSPVENSRIAYILFTSGTSGKPKGICITRENLDVYLHWANDLYFPNEKQNVVALFTSLSFDLTITTLFAPFLSGAKIVIYPDLSAPANLAKILDNSEINIVKMTPSHMQMVLDLPNPIQGQWTSMIVGGENLSRRVCEKFIAKSGKQLKIFNEYGPTETTVGCSTHIFLPDGEPDESVPIGKPGPGMSLYLVDKAGGLCHEGEEGEIFIGGFNVGEGYWKNEGLTQEKFLSDRFRGEGRMYRSGDRGVVKNKNLYCLGRIDEQVKLNGFRIELDDIQGALAQHDEVVENVVFVQTLGSEQRILRAFAVSKNAKLTDGDLREFLKERLPQYMIPSVISFIDVLPVTVHGKLDIKMLTSIPFQSTSRVLSLDGVPKELSQIWAKLLSCSVEELDRGSDFFQLGGNSMNLLRLLHDVD